MGFLSSDRGDPDFVNELGVKWWLARHTTGYARDPDFAGRTLPTAAVYDVEEPDGHCCRVLVLDGQVEYETERLEDMAVHIDVLKLAGDGPEEGPGGHGRPDYRPHRRK